MAIKESGMETVTLKVNGMNCGGCVASVTRVLRILPGVGEVVVALETGTARIAYDPQRAGLPVIKRAIEDAGYEVAG
ncbi:MAG TPA: heavy-metal-associated domain-containing protein [Casimicrobiaceae bacterium]|jgi:copper chaperone|nr:heavy-metal-associated domain-containing protein [Casimicrobiaceae bacterium]